jgi:hypothetical protein
MVGDFMKILYLLVPFLFLATACDNPQRNRLPGVVNSSNGLGQPIGPTSNNPWGNTTQTVGGGTTGAATGTTSSKPPGFENCSMSATNYSAGLGYIGVCQSTLDETSLAILSTISDSNPTCLIPTFKEVNGSSTYLGDPQCFLPVANEIKLGKVYKTRQGFKEPNVPFNALPINGVMIMKQASVGAYYACMDAYRNFTHPACPGGANYSPTCSQMAMSFMTTVCNNFKTGYSYLDIRLK